MYPLGEKSGCRGEVTVLDLRVAVSIGSTVLADYKGRR